MRRRPHHEEHVNHEAWVIPYADLLTLLLALFVVLYAMSSSNTVKYRALAQAISAAFNGSRAAIHADMPGMPASSRSVPSIPSIPMPRLSFTAPLPMSAAVPRLSASLPATAASQPSVAPNAEQQNLERIRNQVEHALQPLIDEGLVRVRRQPDWLEIEIRTDILFPSGTAALSSSAGQVLDKLGQILAPFANPLRVEGYTDDKPIRNGIYPSNWELSAARAASVVRLFAQDGVQPERMGIVGWGQYRPVADNASADGRNRNRRVLVVVLSDKGAPRRFYTNGDLADRMEPAVGAGVAAAVTSKQASTPRAATAGMPAVPASTSVATPRAGQP